MRLSTQTYRILFSQVFTSTEKVQYLFTRVAGHILGSQTFQTFTRRQRLRDLHGPQASNNSNENQLWQIHGSGDPTSRLLVTVFHRHTPRQGEAPHSRRHPIPDRDPRSGERRSESGFNRKRTKIRPYVTRGKNEHLLETSGVPSTSQRWKTVLWHQSGQPKALRPPGITKTSISTPTRIVTPE